MGIDDFMQKDKEWLDGIVQQYPQNIPIAALAEHFGCAVETVRAIVEAGGFGFAWRKPGRANHAYLIPTAQFVRVYGNIRQI